MFEDYLKEKLYLKNVSPLTIKSYRQAFKRFGSEPVNKSSCQSFVVRMRESGLSPVTCNISIRSMNSYLSWLFEEGYIPERLKIKQLKVEKKVIKPYSDAELRLILSHTPKRYPEKRLLALLCTLIETGMRIKEAISIEIPDLDLDNLLIVVRGKGKKERFVPISQELRKLLWKHTRHSVGDFVFGSNHKPDYRSLLKQWKNLCGRLGIEYRGFHSLRHNYGLNFIRQGGDISELQRLLGHSSITTTAMYVNLQTEDLARAHRKTSILSRLI